MDNLTGIFRQFTCNPTMNCRRKHALLTTKKLDTVNRKKQSNECKGDNEQHFG
jgi:hypothetical protein